MKRGIMLDHILTNKELMENVKLKGSLVCGDHEVVEFNVFRGVSKAHSKLITLGTLGFRRADLQRRGAQPCWLIVKDHSLQAQE